MKRFQYRATRGKEREGKEVVAPDSAERAVGEGVEGGAEEDDFAKMVSLFVEFRSKLMTEQLEDSLADE